jgi:aryl-alcohol dehydrogenase-like predicted oxidoreductase
MRYRPLGKCPLQVSELCLGTMMFADQTGFDEARRIVSHAREHGVNFIDTADVYSLGKSEHMVGELLKGQRDDWIVATKVGNKMGERPNEQRYSRTWVLRECDASLQRLGMDHVDLLQIHRWDADTPIEETMEALHDLVKAGKVRYLGASSMWAWQFAKAQGLAERRGWTRFVSMQPELSLLYREEEREMLPLCIDQGVGVIPWSPLARGRLARPWGQATPRIETDTFGRTLFAHTEDNDREIAAALAQVAGARGAPLAQVALAWVLAKPGVTAPIVGISRPQQLADAVAALSVRLCGDEIAALEAPYRPHAVVGF